MSERPFTHLHCHTHYSLLDGANRIPELVAQVKSLGMNAVSITDHGNLYGAIEFYRECKSAGINPVIGYEAYVAPLKRTDKDARRRGDAGYHLTLLAKDLTGFKNLIKMSSVAFLEGYHYVPRIDKDLLEAHSEGIVCLSGCASSEFSEFILKDQMADATRVAEWFARIFGKNFYVEIQNNGLDIQKECARGAIDIANKLGLPLVATSDAHYLTQGHSIPHDVLLCINTGRTINDQNRMRYGSDQFYIRPPEEMYRLFPEQADAVRRSQEIADGCDIQLDFKKRHFPVFLPPDGKTPEDYLRELCLAGMNKRYRGAPSETVRARLEHELGIICRMGFASYMLIVSDFVRFAVDAGIPSSARGSACGALVSYVLELSHVDPLEYDLLFERFLDPNRSEAPDIDIDFCQERREEVIAYVRQKYGAASVAQIATFGTLAARAAIKDVGRAFDMPLQRVIQLTDMIPQRLGITLDEAIAENPDLRALYDGDHEVRRMLDVARALEGTNRQCGIHAAGVVIANGPLTDYVPLHRAMRKGDDAGSKQGEAVVATQWVMGDLEKVGLLKMDFLGLRTLTLLTNAVGLIERTHGIKIDLMNLPLDDKETYDLLQKGDAKGVFQLESDGIRELLKRLRPDNFGDIIALIALYRPGPLEGGMVDDYVNIKHGRAQPSYAHPVMEEVLAETYGVMCIHEDARVSLADGTERPIKLVKRGDMVHALNLETRLFEYKECEDCGPTRFCDGIRLTLENGFSVLLTPDHDVWTFGGWKEVQELDPATDLVAVGLSLPQQAPSCAADLAPWLGADEDVAYLLGFLVGDGCLTGSGIAIATGTEAAHLKLVRWLAERFPTLHVHPYFNVRSWYVSLSHPELLNEVGHGNRKTRLHHLLGSHGLKVDALNKKVPEAIFRCPAPVRAAFLAGLIDSDGCLAETNRGMGVAFVTSSSPALLQGIRRLCQLEGISLKLYPQRAQIWDLESLHEVVSPYLVVKQFQGQLGNATTVGWVPRLALGEAVPIGESIQAFSRRTGIQRTGMRHTFPFIKSSRAMKAGIELGDVRYCQIASAERVPDQQFYGMSVADHHNLVANGVVVKNCYQEQIMRILNRLGGIELAPAYACIKAISKKKYDIINDRKIDFVKGAIERGLAKQTAEEIFDLIVKFGGYGFNKSHSAAYAQLGYQTAYLKRHFTPEFMAALLSSEIDDGNKRDIMVEHIADSKKLGVDVLPPDVNRSYTEFSVSGGKIVFGLAAIKGCGRAASEGLVRAREEGGRFRDVFDFCERIDHKAVPRAAIEKLIKAGAFDKLGGHRAQLMQVLTRAIQAASERQEDKRKGQRSLFDIDEPAESNGVPATETLPEVEPWPETEKLKYEKEVLDFYMTSHPLAQREAEIRRYITHGIGDLKGVPADTEVTLGGMLTQVRVMTYKKPQRNGNTRYGRCKIEDFGGIIETVMWGDEFNKYKDAFVEDQVVIVRGRLERKTDEPVLQATRLLTLEQAQQEMASKLHLLIDLERSTPVVVDRLAVLLKMTPGACPVLLTVRDRDKKRCILQLGRDFHVNPATYRRDELEDLLGSGGVQLR